MRVLQTKIREWMLEQKSAVEVEGGRVIKG